MPTPSGTGIIIGRFQVFELNEVHQDLIRSVQERHAKLFIILGTNPAPSSYNPLDWVLRQAMFHEVYGDSLPVSDMPDLPDDRIWSQELDRRILDLRPEGEVVLYGTEAGFRSRYSGRYHTEMLESETLLSLDDINLEGKVSLKDFRAGVIFGHLMRFPTVYPTVDIALMRHDQQEVLLARKANETRWRFPGGFADPVDESFELAAIRELMEECGDLDVTDMVYLGSYHIDDWRYRNSLDSVMTHFYIVQWQEGEPVAQDDIAEVRWFELARLRKEMFVAEHRGLFEVLEAFVAEGEEEM